MSIEVKGANEMQRTLQKLEKSLSGSQMKAKMHTMGEMVKTNISESFEDEKSPFGKKWKPLKKSTKKRKAKRGKSSKILREDGDLEDKWYVKASSNSVTIFNNTSNGGFPYGLTHQFGTSNAFGKGIKVPARPFLPIDSKGELEKQLSKNILDEITNDIDRVFG